MRRKLQVTNSLPAIVLSLLFWAVGPEVAQGQNAGTPTAAPPPASAFQPAMSIGLSTGSHAFFGLDATLSVIQPVNFRISYNRMRMEASGLSFNASTLGFSGQSLILSSDLDLSTLGLIADFPIGEKKAFRLMGGLMINLNNYINVNGEFAEGVAVNDYTLTPERIGTINVNYTTGSPVYPYFGLGFGRSLGVRHLSFALEAGAMLRGRPDIKFNSTGLLSDNAQNGPVLSENFKNTRIHPSIGFRLAYKFNLPQELFASRAGAEGTSDLTEEPAKQKPGKNAPQKQEEKAQTQPTAAPKPAAPTASPFLIVKGTAVDGQTNAILKHAYIELYKLMPDGSKQLERTGPYPSGTFTLGLTPGNTFELNITVPGYKPYQKTLKADPAGAGQSISQSFPLQTEQ